MARAPLRYQFYAVGAILFFTAAFGACSIGIRSGCGPRHAMPACEQACRARGAEAADIEIRMGKRDHSECVCSNGVRLPSPEADTVGTLSFFVPAVTTLVAWGLLGLMLSKRARARRDAGH